MYKMEESESSDYGEDMLEMVDQHDLEFLKDAINKKSYSILKRVKHVKDSTTAKKRKVENVDSFDTLENVYANQLEEPQHVKYLLPIKTKEGVIARSFVANTEIENSESTISDKKNTSNEDDEYILDYDDSIAPQSMAGLLAHYSHLLRNKKVHIGYLCSNLLENPEERISNFRTLFKILDDEAIEASLSIKKLIVVSLLEVFKDILPSYQIKLQDTKNVKLKKDTLKLQKFEEVLLQYYKKYLQRLENFLKVLFRKQNTTGQIRVEELKLGEVALHAMCDLLVTHPYFNYSVNIVQAVIPLLNHKEASVRQTISLACKTVFREDKKEEITLKILRVLNHYVKKKAHNVRPDVLELLLHLKIKDVNIDQQKENQIKQKTIKSHKHNVLKMSKKEKKRKKRLQELEKEMLETKAEENIQTKQKNLTEITKIIFGIYFRVLKSSNNTRVLGVCLEGLAKYSHCINLDYYVDLLNMLNALLTEEWLGYREQIHCVQTVFTILHDQGDSINLDPTRFYTSLYSNLLHTHASTTRGDCHLVLKTLSDVLVKRRKKITNKRTIGFVKRMSTLSLQLLHNGSLGMLALIKQILIQNRSVDILLDLDSSLGDGDYRAEVNDPEYCNASSTGLYELTLLQKYYHPVVSKFAKHIINGAPATGEGSLPIQFSKSLPEQLFTDFDMSEMAFNPPVQIPKKILPRQRRKSTRFVDSNFKRYCNVFVKKSKYSLFS